LGANNINSILRKLDPRAGEQPGLGHVPLSRLLSLAGRSLQVRANRGAILDLASGLQVLVIIHSSAILRVRDEREKQSAYDGFVEDLRAIKRRPRLRAPFLGRLVASYRDVLERYANQSFPRFFDQPRCLMARSSGRSLSKYSVQALLFANNARAFRTAAVHGALDGPASLSHLLYHSEV
jgi:hypothetical protein